MNKDGDLRPFLIKILKAMKIQQDALIELLDNMAAMRAVLSDRKPEFKREFLTQLEAWQARSSSLKAQATGTIDDLIQQLKEY
jgi:hypothetical protein